MNFDLEHAIEEIKRTVPAKYINCWSVNKAPRKFDHCFFASTCSNKHEPDAVIRMMQRYKFPQVKASDLSVCDGVMIQVGSAIFYAMVKKVEQESVHFELLTDFVFYDGIHRIELSKGVVIDNPFSFETVKQDVGECTRILDLQQKNRDLMNQLALANENKTFGLSTRSVLLEIESNLRTLYELDNAVT